MSWHAEKKRIEGNAKFDFEQRKAADTFAAEHRREARHVLRGMTTEQRTQALLGAPSEIRPHIYPMIEDRRGLADIDSIASVTGIAGLHVGPVDLGLGLGLDREDPRYTDALCGILAAGKSAGIPVTMHAVRAEQASRWLEMGFDELVLTADIELLRSTFASQVAAVRRVGGT